MPALDLSDNTILETTERGLAIVDSRDIRRSKDADFIYRRTEGDEETRTIAALYILRAARVTGDGTKVPVVELELDHPNAAYGRRVLEGTARYEDGVEEAWEVQADPRSMYLRWTRHPANSSDPLLYTLYLPGRTDRLQMFQTGSGQQVHNGAVAGQGPAEKALQSSSESELLFYSLKPKNSLRLELPLGRALSISQSEEVAGVLEPEFGWLAVPNPEDASDFVWELHWEAIPTSVNRMTLCLGTVPATEAWRGPGLPTPADATLDFGPFYAQTYLGATLPLIEVDGKLSLRRTALYGPPGESANLRDIVLGSEFLYLANSGATVRLLRESLDHYLPDCPAHQLEAQIATLREEALPLLLLAASRLARLAGVQIHSDSRMQGLRAIGQRILKLRRKGEALPIVQQTWRKSETEATKEPYFTALAFAALSRLAELEKLRDPDQAALEWESAAYAMHLAAMSPYMDGGLWNQKTSAFIESMDFSHIFEGNPEEKPSTGGIPQKEFAYYQVMTALWLGLLETSEQVRTAFEWLDYNFTYATGRGGPTFPPVMEHTFFVLLDAFLRHQHGVSGADTLIQRTLDRGLDGGVPFPVMPFGTLGRTGTLHGSDVTAASNSGSWLANAPYFGLVFRLHYGLDYDHRGWHLHRPIKLAGYPLTRVTGLRHGAAVYAVTWQGTGAIRKVLVDGAPVESRVLGRTEGDHEVNVILAP